MSEKIKVITANKKARFDYHISETIEAGIVLKGTEVKSIRAGKVNLQDSYARIMNNEAWLIGMHVSLYANEGYVTHDPEGSRKLLLNRAEINKLQRKVLEKGVTLIPTKLYFKNGRVKVAIGLATGKKQHDKRQDIAKRDRQREMKRLEKQYRIK
ncbi:MAG: SsrA-binding protein SmpB [Calditrichota bacterium]